MGKRLLVIVSVLLTVLLIHTSTMAQPKGAKALFDSGEGTKVGIATGKQTPNVQREASQPANNKYAGIKYEIFLQKDDGSLQKVSSARVFNTGERIRIQVRTNHSGYLTVRNIGTSGNANVLFSEYVEARQLVEIPKTGAIRFVGAPGTELLEIMLSADPIFPTDQNRVVASNPQPQPQAQVPPPPVYSSSTVAPPPPPAGEPYLPMAPSGSSDIANLPPPPPQALAYNIEGSKSTRPRGAKDLVLVDNMDSKVTVVDRRTWKPSQTGAKDLVIESSGGSNYGVVPVSTLQSGGVLVTEIKLKHR